jgi:putative serine protease PepD
METAGSRRPLRTSALLAVSGLLLASAAGCSSGSSGSSDPSSGAAAPAPTTGSSLQTQYQDTIGAVLPSVVQITTGGSLGSGIVYDKQGDIVTNAHVVGGATSFQVTLANSSTTLPATLVYSYPTADLAVVKLSSVPAGLTPATFADSGKVAVGQIVLAMGNPLGLSSSVTQGIVSAVGRTVSEPRSAESPGATIPNMVQTSAAINPGNSGGALVNLSDQVVGINTLAATDSDEGGVQAPGIGFAIPASTVTSLADQMIKNGKVVDSGRAALGITTRTVLADAAGSDTGTGAGVVSVTPGGPAAGAGVQAGDVITKIGSTAVTGSAQLGEVLASLQPGQKVQITYVRGNSTTATMVTLGTL